MTFAVVCVSRAVPPPEFPHKRYADWFGLCRIHIRSVIMQFMTRILLAIGLAILPASFASAQTQQVRSLLENDQIKVRELRLAPGARLPASTRPNTFLYALTDGSLVFTPPGRTAYELTFKSGEALWIPSQETATANEGDKEVRALVVEIQGRPAPAAKKGRPAKAGKKSSKKGGKKN